MNDFSHIDSNKILIIDDDKTVLDSIVSLLKNSKYKCLTALSTAAGINIIKTEQPLVVLTDLKMESDTSGIELLEEAKKIDPDLVVIVYTAYGNVPQVVDAIKKGAFDFIQKVQTHHDIIVPIDRAFKFAKIQRENTYLRSRVDLTDDGSFFGAVGSSQAIRNVFETCKRVAMTNATVLITGETGTGKEVIARGLHYHSPRRNESFVPVAVGSLPDNLLEGELFGNVRGAFTGATTDKPGLFEAADKGTIFLDEIGEVSIEMQHKLLRVIQERKVRRLGSVKEREIDVRIVSATNQNPEELVKNNKLREDLYYRLNVIHIHIPPLRERKEDVPILLYHFMKKYHNIGVIEVEKISSEALMILKEYDWPGNVRQLQGAVEQMMALATRPEIRPEDLPEKIRPTTKRVYVDTTEELDFKTSKARITEAFEKQYIENLLEKYNNNITKVAEAAGLNRKTIYRLIDSRDIKFRGVREEFDEDEDE
ncbi:MAG TPA: sigma-54 dependent transcriptional regulator [bacterium]|nr:sigma-54 dependent transcriptional regulator [bacterium]HPN42430.1 sigma-54 dependent transcriptional regulator [bacterium]